MITTVLRRAIAVVSIAAAVAVMITTAAFGQPSRPVDPIPAGPPAAAFSSAPPQQPYFF